jgi:hypothetical protein
MSLYVAALFFVLTPGVLVSLPPGGKKMTVALTHAVVFAVVYQLTHKTVYRMLYGLCGCACRPPRPRSLAAITL